MQRRREARFEPLVLLAWGLLLPLTAGAQPPAGGPPQPPLPQAAPETPPVEYASPYDAFDAGAYAQALDGFVDRQTRQPDDPELSLNVGAAHYKLNDFESADAQFYRAAAIGDDGLRAQSLYNLGNSAYRQGKLGDAIDFYMASLEANPDDLDTKFNLEFVREELKKQQQHQDGQDQEQQDQEQQSQEGAEQQSEDSDQGGGEQPEDQQQDPGAQGQDQSEDQAPQDSDGDGIPDAADSPPEGDGSDPGNQGGPQEPQPGMTPEEAERYLQALEEGRLDPNRRGQRGRSNRQAKDW